MSEPKGQEMTGTRSDASVEQFNGLPEPEATQRLLTCLAVPRWATEVAAARPYADVDALFAQAEASAAELTAADLDAALARHPRIGERAGAGHDAAFSTKEQAGVDQSDEAVTAALAAGNQEYEKRFDRVFLIRAAGRSSSEILSELNRRLGNDDETERAETVTQLREIALLRLKDVI
jgi:2-oxo-4-hydroxy-4-carboxy-5-ureidoimidazoline decarboxylase